MTVSLVSSLLLSVLLPTTPRAAVLLPTTPRAATAPSSRAPPPRLAVIVGGASASSQPPRLEQELEQSIVACGEWLEQNGGRRYPSSPITNASLFNALKGEHERPARRLIKRVEAAAAELEASRPPLQLDAADADALASGCWLLKYSNAPEITNLAKLPLGLGLEKVYQRVSLGSGVVENRAMIRHRFRLLRQVTRVVARATREPELGAPNRAGVPNAGNRINVRFMKVVVALRRVLFVPTPFLRIVARPNGPNEKEGRTPTLDLTYVSATTRVSRGGDGSLFVLERRPEGEVAEPMEELDAPIASGRGFDGTTGKIEKM
jgi:hypothetical protein